MKFESIIEHISSLHYVKFHPNRRRDSKVIRTQSQFMLKTYAQMSVSLISSLNNFLVSGFRLGT
jgi:hypothetical protein